MYRLRFEQSILVSIIIAININTRFKCHMSEKPR